MVISSPMDEPRLRCYLLAHQGPQDREDDIEEHLAELEELAKACELLPVGRQRLRRATVEARLFYGKGQLDIVAEEAKRQGARLLICDNELSGGQIRNIEKATGMDCLDRTGLILAIFEQRAQTREAKAQVELARYEYELPRLKGAWTHLERQVGGVGVRGGAGETQIEVDRRMTRLRISQLKRELEHLQRVRDTQRQGRSPKVPRACLVGYTNAGKTSILRALTGEGEPQRHAVRHPGHHHPQGLAGRTTRIPASPGTRWSRTPSASSASCRTSWWRRSAPPWARCAPPTPSWWWPTPAARSWRTTSRWWAPPSRSSAAASIRGCWC